MSDPRTANLDAILASPTYRLAELDTAFLQRPELRAVRMQLELLKPEMALKEQRVTSTVVVFGGTRIVEREQAEARLAAAQLAATEHPENAAFAREVSRAERIVAKSPFYDAARKFAEIVSLDSQTSDRHDYVMVTGGGPGIMEAANRGAFEVGCKSVGLNISLPHEQVPNPYITPALCFQFHYFGMRKLHFLLRAKALVAFPGGFGTMDELFDALTLRQTNRMQPIPVVLFGGDYWRSVVNFQFLADEGVIADDDLKLIHFAETPDEAWSIIVDFHADDFRSGTGAS